MFVSPANDDIYENVNTKTKIASENIDKDKNPSVIWKHEPKLQKTLGPLKTWPKIQKSLASKNMSQNPEPLVIWKHKPTPPKTLGPLNT